MGFSLIGNSGDQTTSTTVYDTSYSASNNPQLDQQGSGAGALAADFSPLLQNSKIANYNPNLASTYAPTNIVSSGSALGDTALSLLSALGLNNTSSSEATGVQPVQPDSGTLSDIFGGNSIYYVLAAIVLLFLSHPSK